MSNALHHNRQRAFAKFSNCQIAPVADTVCEMGNQNSNSRIEQSQEQQQQPLLSLNESNGNNFTLSTVRQGKLHLEPARFCLPQICAFLETKEIISPLLQVNKLMRYYLVRHGEVWINATAYVTLNLRQERYDADAQMESKPQHNGSTNIYPKQSVFSYKMALSIDRRAHGRGLDLSDTKSVAACTYLNHLKTVQIERNWCPHNSGEVYIQLQHEPVTAIKTTAKQDTRSTTDQKQQTIKIQSNVVAVGQGLAGPGVIVPIGVLGHGNNANAIGFTGDRGPKGAVGSNAATGFTGARGHTCGVGSNTSTGFAGDRGPKSAVGSNAAIGYTGNFTQGFTGAIGFTGFIGRTNAIGSTGAIGPTGSTGTVGPMGPRGFLSPDISNHDQVFIKALSSAMAELQQLFPKTNCLQLTLTSMEPILLALSDASADLKQSAPWSHTLKQIRVQANSTPGGCLYWISEQDQRNFDRAYLGFHDLYPNEEQKYRQIYKCCRFGQVIHQWTDRGRCTAQFSKLFANIEKLDICTLAGWSQLTFINFQHVMSLLNSGLWFPNLQTLYLSGKDFSVLLE